jgi:hypothetical protein
MAKNEGMTPGHGDNGPKPTVQKGTFMDGGATNVPLQEKATSVNSKTGNVQSGEKHGY